MVDHALGFLLTGTSSGGTRHLDTETAKILRESARVERYQECGWFCATGFDAQGRVTVMVHANSAYEISIALGEFTFSYEKFWA